MQAESIRFPVILFVLFLVFETNAQDLEPRSLSAVPTGGNFAIASYGYSSGNILVDNTLPIEDLNARLNSIVLAYARSFKLFNRLAKFDVIAPYSFGHFEGVVSDIDSTAYRSGLGDPLLRLSMVLVGARPMKLGEFMKTPQKKFKLGTTVRLRIPLGQYDPAKLINLGANRWAVKLGVAGSYTFIKRLTLETHLNFWLFTENKEFFNGNRIKQKPLMSAQMHLTWVFKPGVWVAVSYGRSAFGETVVNGTEKDNLQNSTRMGAAFAYKLSKHNAIKIAVTSGLSTRYGADFTSVLLVYQFMWFDNK
jgi:hypothetical protein